MRIPKSANAPLFRFVKCETSRASERLGIDNDPLHICNSVFVFYFSVNQLTFQLQLNVRGAKVTIELVHLNWEGKFPILENGSAPLRLPPTSRFFESGHSLSLFLTRNLSRRHRIFQFDSIRNKNGKGFQPNDTIVNFVHKYFQQQSKDFLSPLYLQHKGPSSLFLEYLSYGRSFTNGHWFRSTKRGSIPFDIGSFAWFLHHFASVHGWKGESTRVAEAAIAFCERALSNCMCGERYSSEYERIRKKQSVDAKSSWFYLSIYLRDTANKLIFFLIELDINHKTIVFEAAFVILFITASPRPSSLTPSITIRPTPASSSSRYVR